MMDYINPYGDTHPDSPWYKPPEEDHYDPREDEDLYRERERGIL